LLGASPGASTAVSVMLDVVQKCFKDQIQSKEWQSKLKVMIPSFGQELNANPDLLVEVRKSTTETLKLN
jgi:malate dehydrogenase (quinone)